MERMELTEQMALTEHKVQQEQMELMVLTEQMALTEHKVQQE